MKKPQSIAQRLIINLNIIFSIVLILIFFTTYFVAKNEINKIFDAELKKSALVTYEIAKNHQITSDSCNLEEKLHHKFFNRYDYEIILQIWENEKLIYNSSNKIIFENVKNDGFFDLKNHEESWRNFVYINPENHLKIAIFENYNIRKNLILEISTAIFFIIFAFSFLIVGLIVKIINRELAPLHNLSKKLVNISLGKYEIINPHQYPFEIQPFVNSFNQLMIKLQQILENEKKFTNHAAHELNTPLTAIRLQAEILQENYIKNQPINFNNIIIAVDRASHLINQILILSRIENEIDKSNFEYCNINNLCDDILDQFNNNPKFKKINLQKKFDFASEQTPIKVNKIFFKILINNILDNAIKYNLNEDLIEFNVSNNKNNLLIKITNSSETIKSDDKDKIFNKFFRANKSPQTKHIEGCGLGLNIVKQIVKIHDGKIQFVNNNNKTSVIIEFKN